jgi:hypothetical protein
MGTKPIYIFIIAILIIACKEDHFNMAVKAGSYDSDLRLNEFKPILQLSLKFDTLRNYWSGIDSFDINKDGISDLSISRRILPETNPKTPITEKNYPYCFLKPKNGLEVATKNEQRYLGLGQTTTQTWVNALAEECRIDNFPDWSGTLSNIAMWMVPPVTWVCSYGTWYNVNNKEMFIGIRMKISSDFKYGWIKIDQVSRENMALVSYALEY